MATSPAGFPIIGSPSVWSDWGSFGLGAWNAWFMAPYGEWVYCGFVKNDVSYFRKINIGTTDANYDFTSWDFGLAASPPGDIFPYETDDGYPNGSMGLGVIRGATPKLYLAGRSAAAPNTATVLYRFLVNSEFTQEALGLVPFDDVGGGGVVLNVNNIAGIEVDAGTAIYIATNNNSTNEFQLRRYAYVWDGGDKDPSHKVDLSPNYMSDNTNARIRGIAMARDGSVIVFVNTGLTSTDCKVLKFNGDTLAYEGQATWLPSISTSTWAWLIQTGEVFMYFLGLDSSSSLDWKTAIYYDNATQIPSEERSNFVIASNLTQYGSDTAVALNYYARDFFNIPVENVNAKFTINGEDENDSSTWTDRVGGIQDSAVADFFNAEDVPEAIHAIVQTDGNGLATAYYKPMRAGTGTERDLIDVFCPSDS